MRFLYLSLLFPAIAFADSDQDLNIVYHQVLKTRSEHAQTLKQSQRDWLKFIDSDCKADAKILGGQLFTVEYDSCIEAHKIQRTQSLKDSYLH